MILADGGLDTKLGLDPVLLLPCLMNFEQLFISYSSGKGLLPSPYHIRCSGILSTVRAVVHCHKYANNFKFRIPFLYKSVAFWRCLGSLRSCLSSHCNRGGKAMHFFMQSLVKEWTCNSSAGESWNARSVWKNTDRKNDIFLYSYIFMFFLPTVFPGRQFMLICEKSVF